MWIAYNKNTGYVVKSFHLKKKAKEYLTQHFWPGADRNSYALLNINQEKLAEWKTWLLLGRQ